MCNVHERTTCTFTSCLTRFLFITKFGIRINIGVRISHTYSNQPKLHSTDTALILTGCKSEATNGCSYKFKVLVACSQAADVMTDVAD